MAFDISVRPEQVTANEDRRWAAHRKGYDSCRPITLDMSAFAAAHIDAKGAIPSGTVLARITATGKYGPYTAAAVDGLETAAGFLFSTTPVDSAYTLATAADVGAGLFWEGIVNQDYLPAFTGTPGGELDAAARAELPHIRFEGTNL